ncbi:hypothetical protein F2Q68_00045376 [Brassica cretica]|uniref:Uncharacterized protein n=1 Tax=Brassica cretica TaxID=69181 RepID=A0A8S9LNG6_BRACR|nr:hypothetical protein F2Q68_00045376 [Brassica cretica]
MHVLSLHAPLSELSTSWKLCTEARKRRASKGARAAPFCTHHSDTSLQRLFFADPETNRQSLDKSREDVLIQRNLTSSSRQRSLDPTSFILGAVHNAVLLIVLIARYPDADLRTAKKGQYVKVTGSSQMSRSQPMLNIAASHGD